MSQRSKTGEQNKRIRLKIIPIAILLTFINTYWISSTWSGAISHLSLLLNTVFIMFTVSFLNVLLRKISNHLALRPAEMLILYMVLAISTGATGHETVEMLTQVVGYPFWFASPENEYEDLFFQYIPRWLTVENKNILEGFYTYDGNFYEARVFREWVQPLMFWAAFLVVLYFCMMCISIIFRKQWMEREKLSFPVAQVPLGIMNPKLSIYKNKVFWYGFGGAVSLSMLNGLHRLYPLIPGPTYGKYDVSALFTEKPWNAIEGVFIEFLPFVLGVSFFIPVALSFSIWFFFWFWKLERVLGSAVGVHNLPGFPGYGAQGTGAVILLFLLLLFWAKQHLWQVLKSVFRPRASKYAEDSRLYTFAVLGLLLGMTFLVSFLYYAGMSLWIAIMFMAGFYMVSTVLTRVRAELGPPSHDFPFGPTALIVSTFGTKRIDGSSLTQFAMFEFVDYGNRSNVMPQILENLYIKERLRIRQTALIIVMMVIAMIIGSSLGLIGNVQRGYRDTGQTWVGDGAFPALAGQLKYPAGTDFLFITYSIIGGIIAAALMFMNRYFVWWPFHPLGYILGGEWLLRYLWFSIFIAWGVKWAVLKFGGLDGHRKAVPLFIGITVGDAVMLSLWSIYGNIFNKWTLGPLYW
jgi:hypothetical protein